MNLNYATPSISTATDSPSYETRKAPAPLSANEARKAMEPFRQKRNAYAVLMLVIDLGVFGAGLWLAITGGNIGIQLLGMLVTWVGIVRLFLIGHDACHQALTSNRNLNHWMGRIAFMASLSTYSLWRVGHNVVHHGFNSLRKRDFVWEPKTPEEYAALTPWRKRLERLYRSAAGPAAYYLIEIWWRKMYFPNRQQMPTLRWEFKLDSLLVTVVAAVWLGAIWWYTRSQGDAFWPTLLIAFVIPLILWNWTIGLIVYLHHTHPDVPWFSEKSTWQQEAAQVSATLHMVMPWPVGPLMHHIMEHPAHHLDATIPFYNLKQAQQHLRDIGARFTSTPFTLKHYLRCVRTCQLYDYQAQRWTAFPK